MATDNNMTLYERIMAYRVLKQKGLGGGGEDKGGPTEDDTRRLERSDTGWGSVDISQYTNKKDSDDNRTPTPPPTLTEPMRNRSRQQGDQYEEKLTARDVHVQMEENINKKEPLPPVRSATPQKKRTPTPTKERSVSRQSNEMKRHHVLPPIDDSRQETVQQVHSEQYHEENRTRDAAVVATTVATARSERREDIKKEDRIEDEYSREEDRRSKKYEEDRKSEYVRREEREDTKKEREEREKDERREDKRYEKKDEEEDRRRNERQENRSHDGDKQGERSKRTPSPQLRQKSRQRRAATPEEKENDRRLDTPPKLEAPERSENRPDQPVVQRAAVAAARGAPQEARRSPAQETRTSPPEEPQSAPPEEPRRARPKRREDDDNEIARLDKMVDRDLNEIVNTLGKKGRKSDIQHSEADQRLKNKIFNPSFQADMDNYLRDI